MLALVIAIVLATFVLLFLVNHWSAELQRLLRLRHPEVLQALDEDGEGRALSPAMLRFLWRREYRTLGDAKVTRIARRLRSLAFAYSSCVVLLFAWDTFPDVMTVASVSGPEARMEDPRAPDARRETALEHHRKGRYKEAIRVYDELLGPVGADGELVYWRGMAYSGMGNEDKALVDLRRVMDLEPGWIDAYVQADRILSRQRRFDDCVDLWSRYLRAVPGDATAHMERGGAHYHRGDIAAAYEDARRACELGKAEACRYADRMKARL